MSIDIAKIQPLDDRVLVERFFETQTSSGLILTHDQTEEPVQKGTVLAVGPGLNGVPMTVKPGDTVHFSRYVAGAAIAGDNIIMMRESDIYMVEGV